MKIPIQTEEEKMEKVLAEIARKVGVARCSFNPDTWYDALKDVSRICEDHGFGILGEKKKC